MLGYYVVAHISLDKQYLIACDVNCKRGHILI